ncbi:hypothetical protein CN938_29320 [Bacillus thuringiensis]|nr:hypothetical protein CN442_30885 [Bacillus thuringiensis]PGM04206.1 hypothetical protein CN938_29320 [Bacillus thuringiensis]
MLTTINEIIDKIKAIPVNLKYFLVFGFFFKRNTKDVINKINVASIAIANRNEKNIFIYVAPNL